MTHLHTSALWHFSLTAGLFEPSHMQYDIDRDDDEEPSLEEMTEKAIKMLQKDEDGFFLLVEGTD